MSEQRQCPNCEVWHYNGDEHICVKYEGPPCKTCGKPTVFFLVGAPGYGQGRACKDNHVEYIGPHGILTVADVI